MRTQTESRLFLSLAWLAGIGCLTWLTYTSRLATSSAVAIGAVGTVMFAALEFAVVVCPSCGKSLYGANRSRCRVCGFDLRDG